MKKLFYLFLAAFSFAVVFPSCSNGSSGDGEYKSPMNYTFLTANRCYIGGSLIWNPSGKAGQLSNGTKIGVRIGHLKKITETIPAADGSKNEYTVTTTTLDNSWATLSGSSTVTKVRYEDEASKAEYGYITINDVNADSINITWTKVDSNEKTSSKSFTIKKGESCDLNGNGNPDLKYDTPAIKRTGYENARWLTFLNDNTTAENTMYYTFSAKEVQAGYRALFDDQSSSADDGLYGVNSNNDFIYISNSGSTAFDYAYGDYVVCMPDAYTEPKFEELGEIPDDNEYYDVWGDSATPNTNVDLSFGGKAYVAGKDNDLLNQVQFKDFDIEYAYGDWQFPDPVNGPLALYSDLAENDAVKNCLGEQPSDAAAAITQINSKLTDTAFFNALVEAKSSCLTAEEKSSCQSAWNSAAGDDTKIKYCRIFIDEFYDESPDAVIEAPELGTIYPSMVLNVGSIDAVDESLNTLQHTYMEDPAVGDRKINSKYNEFVANRKKIRDEWAKFRHVDLTSVVMLSSASGNRNLNPKKAGFNLGLGVKLTASNPSGRIKVEAGSAIFLDLDLSLDSLNAAVDTMTANAAGKSMEKLLKKFFKSPKCEVKMADVQIAGPLPFVVGAAIKFGFNINLGNWNPHICFCGLYGAESNVEVEYGVNWFCKPYIRGRAGGRALYPTEIFVGVENPDGTDNVISFEPWFQIIPSFGLGYTVASVRGSFPIKLGSEFAFDIKKSGSSFKSFCITFGVDFNAYAEADIKIAKLRYDIASPNLAKGKLRLYPTPVEFIKQ